MNLKEIIQKAKLLIVRCLVLSRHHEHSLCTVEHLMIYADPCLLDNHHSNNTQYKAQVSGLLAYKIGQEWLDFLATEEIS